MYLEERIKIDEKKFMETKGYAPSYIALSVYGYTELIRETAVREGKSDKEWDNDLNWYEGLQVLVSQDISFPEFILL